MYHLSLFLAKIKFCFLYRKKISYITYSKNILQIIKILYKKGFIETFYFDKQLKKIKFTLKYNSDNKPLINNIIYFYKSRRKLFRTVTELKKMANSGGSLYVVSTSYGILTLEDCIFNGVGGILIFKVF